MPVNIYFLIVGILSILFSFTHAINGHNTILRSINLSSIDLLSKTTIFYVWHILTVENFLFGIAFIAMAFYKNSSKVKFAAWLIALIIISRWGVIIGSILLKNIDAITNTIVDTVAIIVFVGLIILGIMKKDKIESRTSN